MRPANIVNHNASANSQAKKKGATQNLKSTGNRKASKPHGNSKYTLDSGSISNDLYPQKNAASFDQDPLLHIALLNNPNMMSTTQKKESDLNAYEQYLHGGQEVSTKNTKTLQAS